MAAIDSLRQVLIANKVDLSKVTADDIAKCQAQIPESLRGVPFDKLAALVTAQADAGRSASSRLSVGRPVSSAAGQNERVANRNTVLGMQATQLKETKAKEPDPPSTPSVVPPDRDLSSREFVSIGNQQMQNYDARARELQGIIDTNRKRIAEVQADMAAARDDLAEVLIPEVTPAILREAAQQIGLKDSGKLYDSYMATQKQLEANVSMAQTQVGTTDIGVLQQAVANAQVKAAQLEQPLETFNPPVLDQLIRDNWGTSAYEHWTWVSQAWRADNASANAIIAATGSRDFADLKAKYAIAKRSADSAKATLGQAQSAVSAAQNAQRTLADAKAALAAYPQQALQQVRQGLLKLIDGRDRAQVAQALEKNAAAMSAFRRADANKAKIEYLQDLVTKIQGAYAELSQEQAALGQQIRAYNGKKRGQTVPAKSARWKLGCDNWQKRDKWVTGYNRSCNTVYVYNTYDSSPSFFETWFWWNVFTAGSYDRYYVPSDMYAWQQSNPGWVAPVSQDWAANAAAQQAQNDPLPPPPDAPPAGPAPGDPNWGTSSRGQS